MHELINKKAREIVHHLKTGELRSVDLLDALESRIDEVDDKINALPTRCFERARSRTPQIEQSSILAGLPVPIKDLTDVAGVRTTYGSKISEHHVPDKSNLLVERIESNGGLIYAKSNTPEFGSGGNTFNDVFGATRNPRDVTKTAGGSSGGAAAAVASGMAWVAHGSDTAGSLRTPASFCGVCSLRPSPGLIASSPGMPPFSPYPQNGPMARDIVDLALFADALTGISSKAASSKPRFQQSFQDAASEPEPPAQVAVSADLGIAKTDETVRSLFASIVGIIDTSAIAVEEKHPDLGRAIEAVEIPRALEYAASYGASLDDIRDQIKPENIWNIEYGLALQTETILQSMHAQSQVFDNAVNFMQNYDLLICPATVTTAFPLQERYLGFSEGLPYEDYYHWLGIAYAITATTLPTITLPVAKSQDGLPLGIQLIGKPHGEIQLFKQAVWLEQLFGWDNSVVEPIVPD